LKRNALLPAIFSREKSIVKKAGQENPALLARCEKFSCLQKPKGGRHEMKKAVLILSIICMIFIFVQSWFLSLGGSYFDFATMFQGGIVGKILALLFIAGGIAIMFKPQVAMVVYFLGGAAGVLASMFIEYQDLFLWGIVALVLGLMSYLFNREEKEGKPGSNL
jgi:hypothetical protein